MAALANVRGGDSENAESLRIVLTITRQTEVEPPQNHNRKYLKPHARGGMRLSMVSPSTIQPATGKAKPKLIVNNPGYDSDYPVLCMDEQPVQFHKEVRQSIPATKDHARRVDYEYERCGTGCVFMFTEALAGWRQVSMRNQRTKTDWASEMEALMNTRYRKAKKVILICDNLNTHTRGAFYETFSASKARALVKRIEFRYTPKHGSWLNVAENELSSLTRQCVTGRRFASLRLLQKETKAWSEASNKKQKSVDWQFNVQAARRKLKSLYPKIKT